MTQKLYNDNPYQKVATAEVIDITEDAVILNQTAAYAAGGGQPGDTGTLAIEGGQLIGFSDTQYSAGGNHIAHIVGDIRPFSIGARVEVSLDWPRRYRLMRMHSALHVLCGLIDAPVMGGGINTDTSRIDFDLPEPVDKEDIQSRFDEAIARDYQITSYFLSKDEAEQGLEKVRTAGVAPTVGEEGLRMVKISLGEDVLDDQPCGGTHVKSTAELKGIVIKKIEKKNKNSRRIRIALEE